MHEQIQEKYVDVDGIKTHYWEVGNGEPVIFLHGGGAGADAWGNWHHIMPHFANEGFHVLALDMVGFGFTDTPDPQEFEYSNDSRIQHVIGFIQALNLRQVNLVGNSMGGAATLGVAMKRPELVKKMVLLGAAGRLKPQNGKESDALQAILNYEYSKEQMYQIARSLTNESYVVSEELVNYRLKLTERSGVMRAYQAIMKWVKENGMYYEDELFRRIKHQTLIIHGKNDKVVPVADSWEMLNLLENASLYVVPNCGHWVMLEYPEEFVTITVHHLKRP
ncbi:HOPDA dehydrolase (plasmid) [Geobacillus genomosp. 3]|uniref:HOPDA dehydrolase n=1 Tax=Geobacillus genomosp. 3 TaxID=1921421 RepID=Q7WZF2_GEOG3|nr:alpha/beta hydrolase [Geobacillus genomosp. 3]AGT33880.1 HOPDA dehydrolase [Geobacillus genomosp. 3]BAC79225.1 HOPDA hydrolase [Geobacillus genomosp. 3]